MEPANFRNRWVFITGASSGLGREFARLLAYEHGANLVVLARRADRLQSLKEELESRALVQVRTLVQSLSNLANVDAALEQASSQAPLYAAILNAGVTHFGKHEDLSWPQFESMLYTNVTSVARMTNYLVPRLESYPNGALMIVSSMAGLVPVPYQTAYSATKAFLVQFVRGLSQELRGRPVSLTAYAPAGIQTEMTAGESFGPLRSWLVPVDRAAKEGIKALVQRKTLHVPGWANRFAVAASTGFPGEFVARQLGRVYRKALSETSSHVGSSC